VRDDLTIVLAGIGGYGEVYLQALLDEPRRSDCHLLAVVDPVPDRSPRADELRRRGIPIHASLEQFYSTATADLAVLSTPIHFHCPQTCLALHHGSAVLCEKPAAATVQEVDRMLEEERRSDAFVAIGYQWSFSPSILRLKHDIYSGLFGAPRRGRSLTLWPRSRAYYTRNAWVGRQHDDTGRWILDSPANNAMAHDLHNLLFLLGDAPGRSAVPRELVAETYRANPIENYDTIAVRIRTDSDVDLVFLASHAVSEVSDPAFLLEFEDATVEFAGGNAPIVAFRDDESVRTYPSPNSAPQATKLWASLEARRAASLPACGLPAARAHTVCVNGIQESVPEPIVFPADHVAEHILSGHPLLHVPDLPRMLRECYSHHALPHELHAPWARPGRSVDLRDYCFFARRA
jgi:predicted dehydrogenase